MSRIRGSDTKPEKAVRRILTDRGYRYRLQYKKLPGRPDIAFIGRRKIIWVHGCFWHRHRGCRLARMPRSRAASWRKKLEANRRRDAAQLQEVESLGWSTCIVWECELNDPDSVADRLVAFLEAAE